MTSWSGSTGVRYRIISTCGFNSTSDLVDADVVHGQDVENALISLFAIQNSHSYMTIMRNRGVMPLKAFLLKASHSTATAKDKIVTSV